MLQLLKIIRLCKCATLFIFTVFEFQLEAEQEIPTAVQTWIINNRICGDNETLEFNRVTCDGFTIFVYIVAAKSVGLTKETFNSQKTSTKEKRPTQDPPPVVQELAAGAAWQCIFLCTTFYNLV